MVRRWRVRRYGERPDLDYPDRVRKNGVQLVSADLARRQLRGA